VGEVRGVRERVLVEEAEHVHADADGLLAADVVVRVGLGDGRGGLDGLEHAREALDADEEGRELGHLAEPDPGLAGVRELVVGAQPAVLDLLDDAAQVGQRDAVAVGGVDPPRRLRHVRVRLGVEHVRADRAAQGDALCADLAGVEGELGAALGASNDHGLARWAHHITDPATSRRIAADRGGRETRVNPGSSAALSAGPRGSG
jgi:hypothetical protein